MAGSSTCEGCGGLVPPPDPMGNVECPSCGRHYHFEPDRPAAPANQITIDLGNWTPGAMGTSTFTSIPETFAVAEAVQATKRGCGIVSLVVTLIVLASVGGTIYAVFSAVRSATGVLGSGGTSKLYPLGGTVSLVPGGEGTDVDLISMVTDNGDGSSRKLVRVQLRPSGSELVWKGSALPKDAYSASTAVSGDALFVGADDQVLKLDLATGTEQWRASLTDKVSTRCDTCFQVIQGKLVVRTDDSYLYGFGPASNEPLWSRRLNSPSAGISLVGGNLLLVDDGTPAAPAAVQTLDPSSGKTARQVVVGCTQPNGAGYQTHMSAGDDVLAVPGTTDVVSSYGFGQACATRWDAKTGAVRWSVSIPADPADDHPPLVSDKDLVFATSDGVARLDINSGAMTTLEPLADEDATPRAIVGRMLVADTRTTRGTTKGGLAAWNLDTGKRQWANRLPSGAQLASEDSSDALFDGSPRSVVVRAGNDIRVATFTGETRTVAVQTLLADGTLSAGSQLKLLSRYSSSGTPSMEVEAVAPDRLIVTIDGLVEVVPLTGGPVLRWPG